MNIASYHDPEGALVRVDEDTYKDPDTGRLHGSCRACDKPTGACDEDYCIPCQSTGRHL